MVRAESEGTYNGKRCSIRFLKQNALRSRSKSNSSFKPATKICSNFGITESAVLPIDLESIGSSRQPSISSPSSFAIVASASRSEKDLSTKIIPVAYLPTSGSLKSTTSR